MNAVGIIFANTYDVDLNELTQKRTLAAVPFAGRYRLIDFTLSNMVNSGIRNIGLITKGNYQSLLGHVRTGAEWDLDRKNSGLTILPPFSTMNGDSIYDNRLEALASNFSFLRRAKEKYVLMCDSSYVGNVDLKEYFDFHVQTGAALTGLYSDKVMNNQKGVKGTTAIVSSSGRITDMTIARETPEGSKILINTWLINRERMMEIIEQAIHDNKRSLRRDVIIPAIESQKIMAFRTDSRILALDNLQSYLASNLDLLDEDVRADILGTGKGRPILIKTRDSAPTRYGLESKTANSLIADGCIIEGEVRNSVIFRGVRVKKGAVVENSVIMQDSTIGEYVNLNYAILDKNVIIQDGRMLSGYLTHPFFCQRNSVI